MPTSQGLVLATAMAVSAGTIFLFDHLREKYFRHALQLSENQDSTPRQNQESLKPCLLSPGCLKRDKGQRKNDGKKKKRVRFSDDVRDSKGNGELYRKAGRGSKFGGGRRNSCGEEAVGIQKMPPNRAVLYSGILKDRVQRMEYSY
ncbi:DnaJ homolog subfamily C member 25 [Striga asiatica]|uniref:DnaJ homolog subfamily C member 25 n=1 Tax=Striga asiatica TaxID=4170 RepID=A0A5A7QFN3_STRAF|nr:DnaJ homolog subfamily C member 25 [Striga asiatica]